VLNGILWVLRTGAPWANLPDHYPSFQTCHRRFQQWVRAGVMKRIMEVFAARLQRRGEIDVTEAFIDATFASAKKGARKSVKRSGERGRRSWLSQIVMDLPFPCALRVPQPHEVRLAVSTLLQMVVPDAPQNLIGDNAYDADSLGAELRYYGIELIAPHLGNRRRKTQDRRRLRRYRRRWKIKRLFAWLQNSGVWLPATNAMPKTFWACFTLHAA
jgi:transposase